MAKWSFRKHVPPLKTPEEWTDSIDEIPRDEVDAWMESEKKAIRQFETGATRDTDYDKVDYCGILSPEVVMRYGEYMKTHSVQKDGTTRPYDNWKLGIPKDVYLRSLFRHVIDLWARHETRKQPDDYDTPEIDNGLEEALCAIMFNAMGYLFEELNQR